MLSHSFFDSKIFPILLVNFIGILGYSIITPILIFIVMDLGGNGFIYGLLGATYPFFQFIGAPILGRLSDRIGRKKVLIISQVGTFLSWLLFLIAFALPKWELWTQNNNITGYFLMTLPLFVIFIARTFDGFTGGNISVANAYLSDISNDNDRNKNFGQMGVSTSLGFVIGPVLSGLLTETSLGVVLPILLASLISFCAIFIINFRLKENPPSIVDTQGFSIRSIRRFFQIEHKECFIEGSANNQIRSNIRLKNLIKIPEILLLYTIYFLTFFAFSLFYSGFPIYTTFLLEWSAAELGVFLAYSSFVMIIVQGPILSIISKKASNQKVIIMGASLLASSFFLLTNNNIFWLYVAITLLSVGNGLMWPSFLSLLSSAGSKTSQGIIQGYGTSISSLASIFGLIIGGMFFEKITVTIFLIGGISFFVITLLMTLYCLNIFSILKRNKVIENDL